MMLFKLFIGGKKMVKRTTKLNKLPSCVILQDGDYIPHLNFMNHKLPTVPNTDEYVKILKENGIAYRVSSQYSSYLEIWDSKNYTEDIITLPLYLLENGEYVLSEKMYDIHLPSEWSCICAQRTKTLVAQKKLNQETEYLFTIAKEKMAKEDSPVIILESPLEEGNKHEYHNFSHKKLRAFKVYSGALKHPTKYIVVFDCEKAMKKIITLKVPKGTHRIFIGTDCSQINYWRSVVNADYINIVSDDTP